MVPVLGLIPGVLLVRLRRDVLAYDEIDAHGFVSGHLACGVSPHGVEEEGTFICMWFFGGFYFILYGAHHRLAQLQAGLSFFPAGILDGRGVSRSCRDKQEGRQHSSYTTLHYNHIHTHTHTFRRGGRSGTQL